MACFFSGLAVGLVILLIVCIRIYIKRRPPDTRLKSSVDTGISMTVSRLYGSTVQEEQEESNNPVYDDTKGPEKDQEESAYMSLEEEGIKNDEEEPAYLSLETA